MFHAFTDGAGRIHVTVLGVTFRRAYFADDVRYLAHLARTRQARTFARTVMGR